MDMACFFADVLPLVIFHCTLCDRWSLVLYSQIWQSLVGLQGNMIWSQAADTTTHCARHAVNNQQICCLYKYYLVVILSQQVVIVVSHRNLPGCTK